MMISGMPEAEDSGQEVMAINGENALTHAQAAAQAAAMMVGGLPTTVSVNGDAPTPDSVANDNGSSNGDEDPEGRQEEHQHLKMAVELAAVNQAIIALSGQTPITIKPETSSVDDNSNSRKDSAEKKTEASAAEVVTSQQQNGIQASS